MSSELTPREFKARMIERHRSAFDIWRRCHEMLEAAVPIRRDLSSPFPRALDILFIQAFKSHGSLYLLCVHGHGEDGATIARRMLEIAFQAKYLSHDDHAQRELRAKKYLAWYWLQTPDRIRVSMSDNKRAWWKAKYDAHKHLTLGPKGQPFRNWWGNESIKHLAGAIGLEDTYDQDYRFLSQMAHCTAQGILSQRRGGVVEIRTDLLISEILLFGTKYMIAIAQLWDDQFAVIDARLLTQLASEATGFKFGSDGR